jgi:hypothetical protein
MLLMSPGSVGVMETSKVTAARQFYNGNQEIFSETWKARDVQCPSNTDTFHLGHTWLERRLCIYERASTDVREIRGH